LAFTFLKASQTSRFGMLNGFALATELLPLPVGSGSQLNNAAPSIQLHYRAFHSVGSEEAPIEGLASVRRSNGTCSFPAFRFHEWLREIRSEGISETRLTSLTLPKAVWWDIPSSRCSAIAWRDATTAFGRSIRPVGGSAF